jgi:hypothetical protein
MRLVKPAGRLIGTDETPMHVTTSYITRVRRDQRAGVVQGLQSSMHYPAMDFGKPSTTL